MTFASITNKAQVPGQVSSLSIETRLPYLTSSFDDLTLTELMALAAAGQYPESETNRQLYGGDHWLEGDGWTGPRPDEGVTGESTVMEAIERAFVSKNIVREVADRHTTGVVGREPSWAFTTSRVDKDGIGTAALSSQDDGRINEISQALTVWWDEKGLHDIFGQIVLTALLGHKAPLRFYIPPGLVTANGRLIDRPRTLEEALQYVFLHAPSPSQASVLIDPKTMRKGAVYVWQDAQDASRPVVGGVRSSVSDWHAEVVSLAGVGQDAITTIKEVTDTGVQSTQQTARLFLGGRLTVNELRLPVMITEQVRKLQYMVNQSFTMAQQNSVLAGFLERTVLNGQMPGHEVEDETRPGRKRWVPDPLYVGAGAANFIAGFPIQDQGGNTTGYTSPSMVYGQPVTPKTFEETVRMAYKAILEEVQQVHYLLAAENYLSGDSRRQARADFDASLRRTAGRVNIVGRWVIETAVYMAHNLMQADRRQLTTIRGTFTTRVDPGPATSEGIRSAIELFDSGNLDQVTTMEWSGVDDPDMVIKRIEEDRARGVMPQGVAALRLKASEQASAESNAQASATGQQAKSTTSASNNGNNNGSSET